MYLLITAETNTWKTWSCYYSISIVVCNSFCNRNEMLHRIRTAERSRSVKSTHYGTWIYTSCSSSKSPVGVSSSGFEKESRPRKALQSENASLRVEVRNLHLLEWTGDDSSLGEWQLENAKNLHLLDWWIGSSWWEKVMLYLLKRKNTENYTYIIILEITILKYFNENGFTPIFITNSGIFIFGVKTKLKRKKKTDFRLLTAFWCKIIAYSRH